MTNTEIKQAMKRQERSVLARIRKEGVFRTCQSGYGVMTVAGFNALDRLVAAGKIKYSKRAFGYVAA